MAMTSPTRGRGVVSGIVGDYDRHVGGLRAALIAAELGWDDAWEAMADDDSGQNIRSSPS